MSACAVHPCQSVVPLPFCNHVLWVFFMLSYAFLKNFQNISSAKPPPSFSPLHLSQPFSLKPLSTGQAAQFAGTLVPD